MGYPRDVDELADVELVAEIVRRNAARRAHVCDYCGREYATSTACKFPARHARPGPIVLPPEPTHD